MADRDILGDARDYCVDAMTLDGAPIRIRAIRPDDQDRLHEHFTGLSEKSVYFRFMGIKRDLSPQDLRRLTELDFKNHVGLAATLTQNGRERFIGVGRYICGADPRRAEVAFAVLDEFQGHGIGTLLLEHLRLIADANAVTEFEADVLGENRPMLEVFAHSGFETDRSFDSGVVHLHRSTNEMLKK
ncbi:MAG TPA: GNAT family N-acetyltransferase [Candidatus Binatus sp.]|uniref:GNAT family N-acetyltransferase n=1 Tax=Candidatus Binatus sp. TaxID=2811406 RepID=UPI002B49E98B|nr:GNAT family N-acetyltransferase [Candidatus Binatus sp.]HKN12130.1 GNAT family N-acetyltransferase [Candidatus Binatus sp.]